jgi:hypothetical protein
LSVVTKPIGEEERVAHSETGAPDPVKARVITPVKWWAAAGVCFLLLEVYVIAAWIISGDAKPTPSGPDKAPGWMAMVGRTWEIAGVPVAAAFVYFFLVRQWRRERCLTTDGIFVITFILLYWQDPLVNYTQNWATFNAELFNLGSWGPQVPGWLAPQSHLFAEPIIWAWPSYMYAVLSMTLVCVSVMKKAKSRWPKLGKAGLISTCFAFALVLDLIAELIFIHVGLYAYPGGISWLTLWHGHYYQLPANEVILMAVLFTGWASLRYFQDDAGHTFAERGLDRMSVSGAKRTGIRLLAIVGAANTVMLCCFMIPMQWFALHAGDWPKDFLDRSYLSNHMCGPNTTYACPGPSVPINRPDSAHIGPDGQHVTPAHP